MKIKITGKKFNWMKNESNFEIIELQELETYDNSIVDKESSIHSFKMEIYYDDSTYNLDKLIGKFEYIKQIECLDNNMILFKSIRNLEHEYEFDYYNEYDCNNVICSNLTLTIKNDIKLILN